MKYFVMSEILTQERSNPDTNTPLKPIINNNKISFLNFFFLVSEFYFFKFFRFHLQSLSLHKLLSIRYELTTFMCTAGWPRRRKSTSKCRLNFAFFWGFVKRATCFMQYIIPTADWSPAFCVYVWRWEKGIFTKILSFIYSRNVLPNVLPVFSVLTRTAREWEWLVIFHQRVCTLSHAFQLKACWKWNPWKHCNIFGKTCSWLVRRSIGAESCCFFFFFSSFARRNCASEQVYSCNWKSALTDASCIFVPLVEWRWGWLLTCMVLFVCVGSHCVIPIKCVKYIQCIQLHCIFATNNRTRWGEWLDVLREDRIRKKKKH